MPPSPAPGGVAPAQCSLKEQLPRCRKYHQQARRGDRMDQTQQNIGRVHGGEKARREEKGGEEIQGSAAGEVTSRLPGDDCEARQLRRP
jgi:hypothetical protein